VKVLNSVKDSRHTKTELRRIFIDSSNMVATNGRGMVIKPHSKFATPNLYLLNQKERENYTNAELVWWDEKPACYEDKIGKYPNYKRLISNATPVDINIKSLGSVISYLKSTLQLNFYEGEYKKLIKACKELTFTSYSYNWGCVTLYSLHYIIIIAPVFY
jgi:transposase